MSLICATLSILYLYVLILQAEYTAKYTPRIDVLLKEYLFQEILHASML